MITLKENSRTLLVPETERYFGVESDEKVESRQFEIPRMTANGLDLSSFALRINYFNAAKVPGQYLVKDADTNGDMISFSWEFSRKVTAASGKVLFIICAVSLGESGEIVNEWNTEPAEGTVGKGLEVSDPDVGDEEDIPEAVISEALESALLLINQKAQEVLKSIPDDYAALTDTVDGLKRDVGKLSKEISNISTSGISAAGAASGQVPVADGNGGWAWGTVGRAIESVLVENPGYFVDETIDTIQKVRTAMKESDNCMLFCFITDSHIYTSANNRQYWDAQIAGMKALCTCITPTLIIHGGDMVNGSEVKTVSMEHIKHIRDGLKEIGGNDTIILTGNHDTNTFYYTGDDTLAMSDPITEVEMIATWRNWDDGFTYPLGKLYGYRDFPNGVRVVRLHSSMGDGTHGGQGTNWGFPVEECEWVRDVALDTTNTVVFFTHMTVTPEYQGTQANSLPHNGETLRGYIEDFVTNGGKVVGMFSGHVHWDYMAKHLNFYEVMTCLSNYLPTMSKSDATPTSSYRTPPDGAVVRGRTANTVTQGLWDAIVIDPDNETVKIFRFGAGDDREYGYGDTTIAVTGITLDQTSGTLTEGDTVTLTATVSPNNATNKTVTWETSNSSVATVSGGLITALGSGTATITAKTADGNFTATYSLTVEAAPKVNMLTQAVDSSGNPYNSGQGYKSGYRLSSSGGESAQSGCYVSGFMPCTYGQTVEFDGFNLLTSGDSGYNYCYICAYDSRFVLIKSAYAKDMAAISSNHAVSDDNNCLASITLTTSTGSTSLSNMAFIRISAIRIDENPAIYIE